jgi:hypothetical protein
MLTVTPQFITDSTGKKISVVLPIKEFEQMMEQLEDLHDIELYDEAKVANEPSVPIDEAFQIIEAERKNRA